MSRLPLLLLVAFCGLTRAHAEPALVPAGSPGDAGEDAGGADDEPPRTYINLRVGVGTPHGSERGEVCLEAAPHRRFAVEMCGSGNGIWHRDPAPELLHARARVRVGSWRTPVGWLQADGMAGFAELQVGEDDPGFDFGGAGTRGTETAGPEAGVALRWLSPLGAGWETMIDVSVSLAYLPHAPDLIVPEDTLQPSASMSLGFGF